MVLSSLTSLDYIVLLIDLLVLLSVPVYFFIRLNSSARCMGITIDTTMLRNWRIFLYTSVFSTWIIAFLTFIEPSNWRFAFHPIFVAGTFYMETKSFPTWICKIKKIKGSCNCDYYRYADFYPMIVVGVVPNVIIALFTLDQIAGLILIGLGILLSLGIILFLPMRTPKAIEIGDELMIRSVDQMQMFLMTSPEKQKIIVVVDAFCDFCEQQCLEINKLQLDLLQNQLRVLDITDHENIDPIIGMTLNIDNYKKFPKPSSLIFSGGLLVDLHEGIMSDMEFESRLMAF